MTTPVSGGAIDLSKVESGEQPPQNQSQKVTHWGIDFDISPNTPKYFIIKELEKVTALINDDIKQNLSFKNIIPIVISDFWEQLKTTPVGTAIKIATVIPPFFYGEYRFLQGIIAGEVLLKNTSYNDLLSTNTTLQNQTASLISTGVQEILYGMGGGLALGLLYYALFHDLYTNIKNSIVNHSYHNFLNDPTISKDISDILLELKKEALTKV